jgi:hypothetical protein
MFLNLIRHAARQGVSAIAPTQICSGAHPLFNCLEVADPEIKGK